MPKNTFAGAAALYPTKKGREKKTRFNIGGKRLFRESLNAGSHRPAGGGGKFACSDVITLQLAFNLGYYLAGGK